MRGEYAKTIKTYQSLQMARSGKEGLKSGCTFFGGRSALCGVYLD